MSTRGAPGAPARPGGGVWASCSLTGTRRPVAGGSCSGGPRRTSAAVEGTLEDLEGHHLAQRPPDSHHTVSPPWASHVNGSCRLQVLPAAGTWRRSRSQVRRAPGRVFPAGQGLSALERAAGGGEPMSSEAQRNPLGSGEGAAWVKHHRPGTEPFPDAPAREALCTVAPDLGPQTWA